MQILIDQDDLRPLVESVVREVLALTATAKPAPLLTEPEAAAYLQVQPHTLRDARRRGELHCQRVGRFVRYTREQLDAWLNRPRATDAA